MRKVEVTAPSFPEVPTEEPLLGTAGKTWEVLCGDEGHWRAGFYSPALTGARECGELELHSCPELFLLVRGRMTLLVLRDGELREIPLEEGKPVLVTAPHSGYCPDGPHTGTALVVERDTFETEYRSPEEWGGGGI